MSCICSDFIGPAITKDGARVVTPASARALRDLADSTNNRKATYRHCECPPPPPPPPHPPPPPPPSPFPPPPPTALHTSHSSATGEHHHIPRLEDPKPMR